jgi:hypothetical protein
LIATVAAVLLLAGAATLVFFRTVYSAEGLYRLRSTIGAEAAPPERHVVPAGFRGWAVLRFSVAGAPPLAVEGGTLVAEYPASGRLETSTAAGGPDAGFLHREYVRRTEEGLVPLSRMGEVWGEYNQRTVVEDSSAGMTCSAGFFVGSLAEFRAAARPQAGVEPPQPPPFAESEGATGTSATPHG